jgi:16S rRNA (uracil1498-N3)-methyltransferase
VRIFVDPKQLAEGELVVEGEEHHYLAIVRRAHPGDAVEVVDGEGRRAASMIEKITEDATILRAGAVQTIGEPTPFVRVFVPLIKGDRMELCLEKLVEVGVDAITVWPAERSVVKLDADKLDARLAKYRAVVRAAARQCGRALVPQVTYADDLGRAIAALPMGMRVVLEPNSDSPVDAGAAPDITIASGPEGGCTVEEFSQLTDAGFTPAGLGPRILRAETAPMIAVALIRAATHT